MQLAIGAQKNGGPSSREWRRIVRNTGSESDCYLAGPRAPKFGHRTRWRENLPRTRRYWAKRGSWLPSAGSTARLRPVGHLAPRVYGAPGGGAGSAGCCEGGDCSVSRGKDNNIGPDKEGKFGRRSQGQKGSDVQEFRRRMICREGSRQDGGKGTSKRTKES